MTFRTLTIALAALLILRPLAAEEERPFNPADYPAEVQKALHYANDECAAQGGGEVTFAPGTVRTIDLNGDGRDDYIITFGDTKCTGLRTFAAFCGTGGCLMDILVTLPNGKVRPVFDGYVRSYQIHPDPAEKPKAPRRVSFELHGGYCGGHGTPSCFKEKAITTKPFAFKMP
jgi:hypothetical protein